MILDVETRIVTGPTRAVKLPKQQAVILQALLTSKVKFLSREALTEILWPGAKTCKRHALDSSVSILRLRLQSAGFEHDEVCGLRNRGFAIRGAKIGIHRLSPIEKRIAKMFAENKGSVVTHDEIEKTLGVARPKIRVAVFNIRIKMNLPPATLKSVLNVGYAVA